MQHIITNVAHAWYCITALEMIEKVEVGIENGSKSVLDALTFLAIRNDICFPLLDDNDTSKCLGEPLDSRLLGLFILCVDVLSRSNKDQCQLRRHRSP